MDKIAECCTTHLIQGDGTLNEEGLDKFLKQVKLVERSYVVVAVMGPQSSGKSTLLNHLFHTNFLQMNADNGRSQTTLGIWISRCTGIEPCTIVMDVEGTDGQERGEDKAFEKKTSLFAIALSDIVIINMWCHDIGRQDAGNIPLLKTVFGVMLRLFSPRKRTLLFVIRDKTKTPLERLDIDLRKDIQEIWDSVPKPNALEATDLSNFFNVEVFALSNYEEKEEQFKEQVSCLRQKFCHSIAPGGLACDRQGVIPASGFSCSTKRIWEQIKANKDLNLPNHAFMVATVLCEEIVCEKFKSFVRNEDWLELEEDVKSHRVPGFGKRLSSLVENCLSGYDEEVIHYDGNVGSSKREELNKKLMHVVEPAYTMMFEHIQSETLVNFKTAFNNALNEGRGFAMAAHDCTKTAMRQFDELSNDATINQANWDTTNIRDKLSDELDSHIREVQTAKLDELTKLHESNISEAICSPVQALLEEGTSNTWPAIRTHLHRETETAVSNFCLALSAFEMDEKEMKVITSELKSYARRLVEGKAKDEAEKVLFRMKDRFTSIFNIDVDSVPRVSCTGIEDIQAIANNTRTSCLKLLSVMAAIRLDEDVTDSIWDTLFLRLVEASPNSLTGEDPLASTTWEKVPIPNTLITPIQCNSLWNQFQRDTEQSITKAIAFQTMAEYACCDEIVNKNYSSFDANKDWLGLVEDVKSHLVPGFGKRLSLLLENCLSSYDKEVIHYDGNTGFAKRKQLYEKLMHLVQPTCWLMLEHIQSGTLVSFKMKFNDALNEGYGFAMAAKECTKTAMRLFDELSNDATLNQTIWDTTKTRDKISHELDSHISEVQTAKLYELTKLHESNISEAICSPVEALLEEGTTNTWPTIRTHLHRETETAVSNFSLALSAFEIDEKEMKVITSELKNYARRLVEGKAKDVAGKVLFLMKERFVRIFNHDDDSLTRVSWTGNEDIQEKVKTTWTSCLKLLSVMAAIRLDEDITDSIWDTLFLRLVEAIPNSLTGEDPLASTTWEKVTVANTLIPPFKCMSLWKEFQTQTEFYITQAIASQDANTRSNSDNHTESSGGDPSSHGLDPFSYHIGMAIGHSIGAITYPFRKGVDTIKQGLNSICHH